MSGLKPRPSPFPPQYSEFAIRRRQFRRVAVHARNQLSPAGTKHQLERKQITDHVGGDGAVVGRRNHHYAPGIDFIVVGEQPPHNERAHRVRDEVDPSQSGKPSSTCANCFT